MNRPRCSVVITAYNALNDLPECLEGLFAQEYPDFEIILVDNASDDATPEFAAAYLDRIVYRRLEVNRAITGGYNAGAEIATGEIVVFINADTKPQPGWLSALVQPLIDDKSIGMTTSKLLLYDQPHLVNACGNDITWTGLTVCRGYNEPAEQWQQSGVVSAASGASLAMWRERFEKIGRFDETIEFYFDDTDLSLRAQLDGSKVWYASDSHMYHRYEFKFSANKAYYIERNRWLTMLKVFSGPTLLLMLPGLMIGEAIAWVYMATKGRSFIRAKLKSWQWLWQNRTLIRKLHLEAQALRKISERDILATWSPHLSFTGTVPERIGNLLEALMFPFLYGCGRICKAFAVW